MHPTSALEKFLEMQKKFCVGQFKKQSLLLSLWGKCKRNLRAPFDENFGMYWNAFSVKTKWSIIIPRGVNKKLHFVLT